MSAIIMIILVISIGYKSKPASKSGMLIASFFANTKKSNTVIRPRGAINSSGNKKSLAKRRSAKYRTANNIATIARLFIATCQLYRELSVILSPKTTKKNVRIKKADSNVRLWKSCKMGFTFSLSNKEANRPLKNTSVLLRTTPNVKIIRSEDKW